jgi:hypothetical protein
MSNVLFVNDVIEKGGRPRIGDRATLTGILFILGLEYYGKKWGVTSTPIF